MKKSIAFALCAAFAACTGTGEVQYAGQVQISEPDLVQIEPGVYVIADADQPVFYTDDSYWLYRNQRWYRSDTYTGGWSYVDRAPRRLRMVEREPTAYVHYRQRSVARRPQPRQQRDPYAVPRQPVQPTIPAQPYPNPQPPQQQPPVMPNDPGTVERDRNPYATPQRQPMPVPPQQVTPIDRDRGPHGAPSPRTDSPADRDRGRGNDNRDDRDNRDNRDNRDDRGYDDDRPRGPDRDTDRDPQKRDR